MLGKVVTFVVCVTLASVSAQDIGCFVPGGCADSTEVGISFPIDSNGCLQDCKDNPACFYFSYEFEDDLCVQFTECDNLINTSLNQSTSGHVSCDALLCSEEGQCDGTFLDYSQTSTEDDCLDFCVSNSRCSWYTFNTPQAVCTIFEDCERVDTSQTDSLYGQRECREGAPATGAPSTGSTTTMAPAVRKSTLLIIGDYEYDIDVVDLDGRTCDSLPSIPVTNDHYYGWVKNGGSTPVFCLYDYCYELVGSSWSQSINTNYDHYAGAGVQFDDDTYWITGADGPNDYTEFWNGATNSFSNGLDLPSGRQEHCVVALDENTAYIAGGHNGGTGTRVGYSFDLASNSFTSLPLSPHSHHRPACGIAQTASGPEFVVVGLFDNSYVDIYNINSGVWRQSSTNFQGDASYPGYVQFEDTFLVMANGLAIYEYNPVSETFFERTERSSHFRDYSFLMMMDGDALNCV